MRRAWSMAPVIEIAPKEARLFALAIRRLQARRSSRRTIASLFPDDGPLRRELYPKQLEFFRAGATHRERLFMAGNRCGKTLAGPFSNSSEKQKETLQEVLFGPVGAWGTGLIPGEKILKIDRASSPIKDVIDTAYIAHTSGGTSTLQFKAYTQGRQAAEGVYRHVVHMDEEPPVDMYAECLLRIMDVGSGAGIMLVTFTPLAGLSETVRQFLPDGQMPQGRQTGNKYTVQASWTDVPHLTPTEQETLLASMPAYQRDARSRGIPSLGSGVIYPVPETDYLVQPFDIPKHFRRALAIDVGWNFTAALFGAYEQETDTLYLYHEYKRGQVEPSIHAAAIQAAGSWIPAVIDPAAQGRSQVDGQRLMDVYRALGLNIQPADHAVEAGLYACWERISTGRLLVFDTLTQFRSEIRQYARDERGRVIKINDHLMDCMRYLVLSGIEISRPVPVARPPRAQASLAPGTGWMS